MRAKLRLSGGMVSRVRTRVHRLLTSYVPEPLGGGGWVTGIAISPDGLTRLVRTDTLGAWRWLSSKTRWVSTTDARSMPTGYNSLDVGRGVYSIAAANDIAYMAFDNAIFTSMNRGVSWVLSLGNGPKTSENVSGVKRWNQHMFIDPNNSNICIYGTVNAGLYYTLNGGTSWSQVSSGSLPFGQDGLTTPGNSTFGVVCVAIDTSGNWYAAPFGSGLYKSANHGTSWTKISNDADMIAITGLDLASNGDIMAVGSPTIPLSTSTNRVYRYRSGAWTQMSLPGAIRSFRNVAYDPLVSGRVMVQADAGYEYISLDYGDTWTNTNHTFTSVGDVPWLAASAGGTAGNAIYSDIGGLQFDPQVVNRVWMTQGIGVWYADLPMLTTDRIPWKAQTRAIENLVINDVLAPPGLSALSVGWDRAIFRVGEVGSGQTEYPYRYHPSDAVFGSGWHIDYSADDPTWLAASLGNHQNFDSSLAGYSADGGVTWTAFPVIPNNGTNTLWAGSMHVGAPGHAVWISAASRGSYRTTDSGATWSALTIPGVTTSNLNVQQHFYYRRPMASEKTSGYADIFYVMVPTVGVFKSINAGATWVQQCDNTQFVGNDWTQMVYLKSVPGHPGHLFITPGYQGAGGGLPLLNLPFKRSLDGGVTWSTISTIDTVRGFDFGVGVPGSSYPAIYAIGYVQGVRGVYRSDDNAATWTLLSTQPTDTIDFIRNIGASKEVYGLHWITTSGSGLIRGSLT